jgi:hypothetical protein
LPLVVTTRQFAIVKSNDWPDRAMVRSREKRRVSRRGVVPVWAERFVFVGEEVELALDFFLPGPGVFAFRGCDLQAAELLAAM